MFKNDANSAGIEGIFNSRIKDAYDVLNISYVGSFEDRDVDSYVILMSNSQKLSDLNLPNSYFDKDKLDNIQVFLDSSKFLFKKNSSTKLPILIGKKYVTLFFYGLGDGDVDMSETEVLGKKIYNDLVAGKSRNVGVFYEIHNHDYEIASRLSLGMALNKFRFDLKTKKDKDLDVATSIELVEFIVDPGHVGDLQKYYNDELKPLVKAINLTKAYCDGPANIIYPESMANFIKDDFKSSKLGIEVQILEEKEMRDIGMGALLGVAQGSIFKPRFVVMKWNNGGDMAPLLFVGKGVTFDSGGLSIKPANSMEAEGRLVLADAFTYGQTKINPKPQIMIDLATLTGAAIVALGTNTNAAILSNDDKLAAKLLEMGKFTNEKLWRLPLGTEYRKKMDSGIADIQNISNSSGFGGGTITAAEFLKEFVDDDVRWAHLDIANVDSYSANSGSELRGSTAFGIKLLNEFVRDFENNKH